MQQLLDPALPDLARIREAAARIEGRVHRTPVFTCQTLDEMAGCQIFLKAENLQKVGAFKARGAMNAVLALPDALAARGVVTHSSGNHAAALAMAARARGIQAFIVMPSDAPAVKKAAVAGYGGLITLCEPTLAGREQAAARIVAQTGATLIHPFDNADVIAGQGTVALELHEQVADLDAIIAPVSGGGLISGIALASRALRPATRVIAAEPEGADDAARSKAAGQHLRVEGAGTIADGLRATLGTLTWPVVRDLVAEVITVSDVEILAAMRLCLERAKLVVEPSGAASLAAALKGAVRGRVGVVLSGGNVDLDNPPWLSFQR